MACNCKKPCEKDICCSVCQDVDTCEDRCQTCAPKKQVENAEESNLKED